MKTILKNFRVDVGIFSLALDQTLTTGRGRQLEGETASTKEQDRTRRPRHPGQRTDYGQPHGLEYPLGHILGRRRDDIVARKLRHRWRDKRAAYETDAIFDRGVVTTHVSLLSGYDKTSWARESLGPLKNAFSISRAFSQLS